MTEKDLRDIEKSLKIKLPSAYRALMLAQSEELEQSYGNHDPLWLAHETIISYNLGERPPHMGTGCSSKSWRRQNCVISPSMDAGSMTNV